MNSLTLFWDSWPLFQNSVLAGTIAGATLGLLGIYVVIRRMVFLSAALSQISGLGVVTAFYLQILLNLHHSIFLSPTAGALLLSLVVIIFMNLQRRNKPQNRDTQLGLLFLLGGAGTLALGTRIIQEIQDVNSILFGTAVAVLDNDFYLLTTISGILIFIHTLWNRAFTTISLDPIGAEVRHIPVRTLDTLLLISIVIAISIVTRILGALPAFAFSVLPPIAALTIGYNVRSSMLLSAIFGAICGFVGYLIAFLYDLPVGASQTLVAILLVGIVKLVVMILRR